MKKQLSLTLLTLSIFSLNIVPTKAATENPKNSATSTESAVLNNGQWCVELPWMGLFCWDL